MKRNACQKCVFAVRDDNPHCGLRGFRSDFNVEYCSAENDIVPNGYELQEDGYFSWVKKEKGYPKTYEECCRIVNANPCIRLVYNLSDGQKYYHDEDNLYLYENFRRLKICRDAYWKIAGEEMGLGKPWEPDWNSLEPKYVISISKNSVKLIWEQYYHRVFAFPTAEMRDAFKENFDPDIEICKELL